MKPLRPVDQFSRYVLAEPEVTEHGLVRGALYRVKKEFTDLQGDAHPAGEQWMFAGAQYSHYDNVLFLYLRLNERAYELPLRYGKKQDAMTGNLGDYLERIDEPFPRPDRPLTPWTPR